VDNVAHTLIGVGMARAGLAERYGRGTTLLLAVASNVPDVDIFWTMWDGWSRFLDRRTHSHAAVAWPALAALLAAAFRPFCPRIPWRALFGMSLLGIVGHVFFDYVNSFGVVVFWPFSRARPELGWIFIIDLAVWGILAAAIPLARLRPPPERVWRCALAVLGVYVVLCGAGRAAAEVQVRRELLREGLPPAELRIFPEPLGPHRFRAAARVGDRWEVFLVRVFSGRVERAGAAPTDAGDPRVEEIRASPLGRRLEHFMAAPVWRRRPDGSVEVRDLRFEPLVVRRRNPFVGIFPPPGSGPPRVESAAGELIEAPRKSP
jgi:inner membrane protein